MFNFVKSFLVIGSIPNKFLVIKRGFELAKNVILLEEIGFLAADVLWERRIKVIGNLIFIFDQK